MVAVRPSRRLAGAATAAEATADLLAPPPAPRGPVLRGTGLTAPQDINIHS